MDARGVLDLLDLTLLDHSASETALDPCARGQTSTVLRPYASSPSTYPTSRGD